MKHLTPLFIIALLFLFPFNGKAQDTKNWWDGWLFVKGPIAQTQFIYDEDYNAIPYEGTDLRAGMQTIGFALFQAQAPKIDINELPNDLSFLFSFDNPYHIEGYRLEDDERLTIEDCWDAASLIKSNLNLQTREHGGEYKLIFKYPAFNIDIDKDITVLDVPNFKQKGRNICDVGADSVLYAEYKFNTGYPFRQDTLKEENLNFKFYTAKFLPNDKEEWSLPKEIDLPFTLLDKDKPKIAGIYTYKYKPNIKKPGKYLLKMSSTWNNIKRDFIFEIHDTLRAEAKLDKSIYYQGSDEKAILNVKMDYDYPFIAKMPGDQQPTIRIHYDVNNPYYKPSIKEDSEKEDGDKNEDIEDEDQKCIYKDSLLLADDAYGYSHINLERKIELPLRTILANYTFTNKQDTLQLNMDITYDGGAQYKKTLPLIIKRTATGISLTTADPTENVEFFNIAGQSIAVPSKRQGFYIERRNGKAVKRTSK